MIDKITKKKLLQYDFDMPYNYEHLIYLYNKNIYKFVAYIYT